MSNGSGRRGKRSQSQIFLQFTYGATHICALRPDIIASAFRKTGVWPFDRTIVTVEMMVPSLESTQQVTLPVVPPTPVLIISELIRAAAALPGEVIEEEGSSVTSAAQSSASQPISAVQTPVRDALASLNRTAAGFLVSNAPVTPRAAVPAIRLAPITPGPRSKTQYPDLLNHTPATETEKLLQWAL